jgi:hypothetical protein
MSFILLSNMRLNAGGRGGVAVSQPMSTTVHRSLNKLCRSNSIFNLCFPSTKEDSAVYGSRTCRLWQLFCLGDHVLAVQVPKNKET